MLAVIAVVAPLLLGLCGASQAEHGQERHASAAERADGVAPIGGLLVKARRLIDCGLVHDALLVAAFGT